MKLATIYNLVFTLSASPAPSRHQPLVRALALALPGALSLLSYQCQPAAPTEQPVAAHPSSDTLKLETAAPALTPLPKFDVESPIVRQLALLPPAERNTAPTAMRRYQQLTRRFWLAQYSSDYLLKQAQNGHPDPSGFAQQLAYIQSHWRVVSGGLSQHPPMPPIMASHLTRMQQVVQLQQAALADLQADCTAQRPPRPDAATLVAQDEVKKLLAPLLRKPGPLKVIVQ